MIIADLEYSFTCFIEDFLLKDYSLFVELCKMNMRFVNTVESFLIADIQVDFVAAIEMQVCISLFGKKENI